MKIGFIGDIVGKPGRLMLRDHLSGIKQQEGLDFVIANAENASHGFGITPKNAHELLEYGCDLLTGGNHSWDKKDIIEQMDTLPILRPLNYPEASAGSGYSIHEIGGKQVAVINLMGHFTMPMCDNPFVKIDQTLKALSGRCDHILIDFHAEATAEKQALLYMLKSRVDAIFGTHTHVGTDDLQITGDCAYVSDVGLTGCCDNVLGMQSEVALKRFLSGYSGHFDIPKECRAILQLLIAKFDDNGCKEVKKIKLFDDGYKVETEAVRL